VFDSKITAKSSFLRRIVIGPIVMLLALFAISNVAAAAGTPKLNLVVETASWAAPSKATLQEKAEAYANLRKIQEWINPENPIQRTVTEVLGPPAETITVKVVKEPTGFAGDYESWDHQINLSGPQLSVLVHEESHATHDAHILSDSVWEEGEARCEEKETMRLLSLKGITEAGYEVNHSYGYEIYYDNDNVPAIGAVGGDIYAEGGMELERYDQAGYACSKIMMENPAFLKEFNAKLFTHPNGDLNSKEIAMMMAEIQPVVEGQPTLQWIEAQHIFDTEETPGCYLSPRLNQYTFDLYCVGQYGEVTMVSGANVTTRISDPEGKVFNSKEVTSGYGWVQFNPEVPAEPEQLKIEVSVKNPGGSGMVKGTFYRSSGAAEGVFGVVVGAKTGTVTLSSPTGQFSTISVPVVNGAFVAPGLENIRGQAVLEFSGENKAGQRIIDKDAAPYSVVIAAEKMKKAKKPI
jgi:hypothetical protein